MIGRCAISWEQADVAKQLKRNRYRYLAMNILGKGIKMVIIYIS